MPSRPGVPRRSRERLRAREAERVAERAVGAGDRDRRAVVDERLPLEPSSVSAPAVKLCSRSGCVGKSPTVSVAPLRLRLTLTVTSLGVRPSPCATFAAYRQRT
jgi:hypothetical protein